MMDRKIVDGDTDGENALRFREQGFSWKTAFHHEGRFQA